MKVQATGANPTRIWIEGKRVRSEDVPWTNARVAMVCEARSLWVQPKMHGVSIEARQIWVWPGDEDEALPDESDDE